MRILLVHHTWPSESTGGSELYVAALARRLARDHEVAVLHRTADRSRPDHDVQESQTDGGIRRFALNNLHRAVPGFESYRDPGAAAAASRVIAALHPDLVHVHHLSGLSTGIVFEARRQGAAVVYTLHDFATLCALGQLLNLKREVCPGPTPRRCLGCVGGQVAASAGRAPAPAALRQIPLLPRLLSLISRLGRTGSRRVSERLDEMREVLRTADVLVSPSGFLRDRMAALGVAGIEVLDNGHEPIQVPERHADPAGRLRIGFIGVAIPSKGVHVLAEAFRRLDPARAALQIHGPFVPYHGDTGYEARVRAILGPLAAESIRGPFRPEALGDVLAGLDVLVVPSIWEESFGLVVHEAFLARLPVVVSDHGALAERVRDGIDGFRFAPGDATALAAALRRLVDERGLRGRLGQSPPHVPTLDEHVSGLEALYAKARARFRDRAGRVGVVVLDRGRPEDAVCAARSALDPSIDPRVVIVENGPGPETSGLQGVEIVRLPRNLGFAGGMNAGIAHLRGAGCDRVLLLNNDAVLRPGSLRRLAEALEEEGLAAVGPLILRQQDGRVESRGGSFDARSGRYRLAGHGEPFEPREARLGVDTLSGAALMLRTSALDRIGPLDERYFLSFEDVDWCARALHDGLRLAVVLGARVDHGGSRTLGPASPDRLYYAARNHLWAVERLLPLHGPLRWTRGGLIVALNLAHALRQTSVGRLAGAHAVLRGVSDFAHGRLGERPHR